MTIEHTTGVTDSAINVGLDRPRFTQILRGIAGYERRKSKGFPRGLASGGNVPGDKYKVTLLLPLQYSIGWMRQTASNYAHKSNEDAVPGREVSHASL
jgi:hypothetical protein